MIFTASRLSPSASIPQSTAFIVREIKGFTQGKMSSLVIGGVPEFPQLGYDGYRANICAFLISTHEGRRVATTSYSYPIAITPELSLDLPLALPKVAFTLRTELTAAQEGKFLEKGESKGLTKISLSKVSKGYLLERPEIRDAL